MQKTFPIKSMAKAGILLIAISTSGCADVPKDSCIWDDLIPITKNDITVMSDTTARAIDKHNTDFEKNCKPSILF